MAVLKADVEFDTGFVKELSRQIPEINVRFLSFVGARARTILKEQYLSGQELNLSAYPKDSIGRYTVTSDVNKKQTETKVYSYPVNLFEKGRTLRDGSREPGKFIITGKLKQAVMMGMATYTKEFETRIQKDLDKL